MSGMIGKLDASARTALAFIGAVVFMAALMVVAPTPAAAQSSDPVGGDQFVGFSDIDVALLTQDIETLRPQCAAEPLGTDGADICAAMAFGLSLKDGAARTDIQELQTRSCANGSVLGCVMAIDQRGRRDTQRQPYWRDICESGTTNAHGFACYTLAMSLSDPHGPIAAANTQAEIEAVRATSRPYLQRACASGFASACAGDPPPTTVAQPKDLSMFADYLAYPLNFACARGIRSGCSFAIVTQISVAGSQTANYDDALARLSPLCEAGDGGACGLAAAVILRKTNGAGTVDFALHADSAMPYLTRGCGRDMTYSCIVMGDVLAATDHRDEAIAAYRRANQLQPHKILPLCKLRDIHAPLSPDEEQQIGRFGDEFCTDPQLYIDARDTDEPRAG